MVSAHMLVALVIVTLLLYASYQAWQELPGGRHSSADPLRRRLQRLTSATIVLLLIQVGLGTQVRAGIALFNNQADIDRLLDVATSLRG